MGHHQLYGIVYTAKGCLQPLPGPVPPGCLPRPVSWTKVFWAMIVCDLVAAFMALPWLKPLAARAVKDSEHLRLPM